MSVVIPVVSANGAKSTVTLPDPVVAAVAFTAGETTVLSSTDTGNGNIISAQPFTTTEDGTLQSLSFYVRTAAGNLVLGVYDATGPSGGPGKLLAQTASFTPVAGWNTNPVQIPVELSAGNYWLAYLPSSSTLSFAIGTPGSIKYVNQAFGNMPSTFSASPNSDTAQHYSFYATLSGAGDPPPPPPPPPPPTSGTRDPLQQPFASSSIWNMPIGTGAQYVPCNYSTNPKNSVWTPMPAHDTMRIVLTPTAPETQIKYSNAGWSGSSRCTLTGNTVLATVPIPADYVVPSDNTNSCGAYLAADGRTIVQSQPFARCTAGGVATSIIAFPNEDLYGQGVSGSQGGSRMSAIGGCLRLGELRPGQQGPPHALKFIVDAETMLYRATKESDTFRWPALTSDSGAVGDYGSVISAPFACRMGALLAIPTSINIASLGLETEPGKQMAWTLQNYGAYIVDTWSAGGVMFSVEEGYAGSFTDQFQNDWGYPFDMRLNDTKPWTRDIQRIVPILAVVDNNSSTSVGGGGTPLQPLAPEISPPS